VLNFSKVVTVFDLPGELIFSGKELLISNYPVDAVQEIQRFELRPYEARVYRLWR
jgi:oligo-1,6-glucosidase